MLLGTLLATFACVAACGPKVDVKKSDTRLDIAKELLRSGKLTQLKEAELEARKALAYNPDSADAFRVLGLIDYLRAVRNVQVLEVDDCLTGVDAEALREELDRHLLDAEEDLAAAVKRDPEFADAWANRGQIALRLGEHDKSIEYLERALAARQRLSDISLARADLGWAYFHAGNQPVAAMHLRQGLQFNRHACIANYRLGRVYFARKEWEKALQQFQDVAEDGSCGMQEAHLYRLKTMLALKQTQGIDAVREQCMRVWPKSCVARECSSLE
jgi:tetratricopeptide (TPR) repeat protein